MSTNREVPANELKHNVSVSMWDGSFFGLGLGFSSFSTVIPLFIHSLTQSSILIGLVPAIRTIGWQLPQLFMAGRVSRLRHYKPMVMVMTIHERAPFLGFAFVALYIDSMTPEVALALAYLCIIWASLGGGFTANAWQSMIAKIIPSEYRGTFLGAQAAFANITLSAGAIAAGYILGYFDGFTGFALCFGLTAFFMFISWLFLNATREPIDNEKQISETAQPFWRGTRTILTRDINFRWFIFVRTLSQFAVMGSPFYIVFALRRFDMDNITAGFLTAALTIAQTLANAGMGYFGDRFGHRLMLMIGVIAGALSALVAWLAPSLNWFYLVYFLAGMANVAMWTTSMAFIVQFGTEPERPLYIGLANTLIAPASILAPLLGGFLADAVSFEATFILSIIISIITLFILYVFVKKPESQQNFMEHS